ncbi:MAG: hypothetical protein LRZ91_05640 [Desulfotomaculum sp.]|nr:hypothetical protein [Desulfotomaculum sp.]MCL0062667.1 hypothetical protein [Peptococcaceae bacterium]
MNSNKNSTFNVQLLSQPRNYLKRVDKTLKKRIAAAIEAIFTKFINKLEHAKTAYFFIFTSIKLKTTTLIIKCLPEKVAHYRRTFLIFKIFGKLGSLDFIGGRERN